MKYSLRETCDKTFTVMTALSVILLVVILVAVLGPMISKGITAVFFKSTVEFRRMQNDLHDRGSIEKIDEQIAKANIHRDYIYSKIDSFKMGIDTSFFKQKVKQIYRQFGNDLKSNNIKGTELSDRRKVARQIRSDLEKAFASLDKAGIIELIDGIDQHKTDHRITGTVAMGFYDLADQYKAIIKDFDLSKRQQYAESLGQVEDLLIKLYGPRPEDPMPALIMDRYGATRYDLACQLLDKILWKEHWVQQSPDQPMVSTKLPRVADFEGTEIEDIFFYIEDNFQQSIIPKATIYWQYFIDDSTSGHYFGGVGPEILGTLILTVLAMAFVFPLGVVAAAYLVECTTDNIVMKIIRLSINTLAGVPSIIFGLFGLAFFVLFLLPFFGGPSKPCILAASMTLAVLALPVMIRASEEAIRSVPQSYKEASLGLGAGRFRTFVQVTLPAAMPGILTGVILSLSRVAGETAPILFTGACAFGSIPKSLFAQTRTLSYGSYDIAVGDKIGMLVPHKQYGMVVTLVLLIICLNALAIFFRAKIFRRLKGH